MKTFAHQRIAAGDVLRALTLILSHYRRHHRAAGESYD